LSNDDHAISKSHTSIREYSLDSSSNFAHGTTVMAIDPTPEASESEKNVLTEQTPREEYADPNIIHNTSFWFV